MAEETKKVWKVVLGVDAHELEDVLNAHVEEGMQAYRIDRIGTLTEHEWVGRKVTYDIVMFNPMLLGERASKSFSDAILAQISQPVPQGPPPGSPASG